LPLVVVHPVDRGSVAAGSREERSVPSIQTAEARICALARRFESEPGERSCFGRMGGTGYWL
jgi:hypothetical protein